MKQIFLLPFFFLIFSSFYQSFLSEHAKKRGRTRMKGAGAEWGLCNPLAVAAGRICACCTWLMEQLFLHQVVKTHQWWVYKKISLSHHTCGSMDLQEASWFLFTLFHGFWRCWKQFYPLFGQKHFRRLPESALIYLLSWRTAQRMPLQPRGVWVSVLLTPSASTHLEPGEPGNGTEAVPYPAGPGKFLTRRLCCFPLA